MSAPVLVRILDPQRRATWLESIGTDVVPVLPGFLEFGAAPGIPAGAFYRLDMARLSFEQQERLVSQLCRDFDVDAREVPELLARHGVPVRADDTEVIADGLD